MKTPEYIEFLKTRISPNVKPEIAKLMIEYALTPEEHEMARRNIEQYCFTGMHPEANPKIFLIIAQTGGGKSTLTANILKNNPNTVVIDSDAFKAFNPKRQIISAKYPTLYGYLTGIDAYLHRDEIYKSAIENGYNILIEIAPSTKERLFNIDFEELKNYGYTVDANILAVSLANSLLSVHERFEGQIEAKMAAPKLTDFKRANDSYNAVDLILEDLIKMPEVNLSIWQRGQDIIEENFDECEERHLPEPVLLTTDKTKAVKVFNEARVRDDENTKLSAPARIKIIKAQMETRKAPTEQRAQFSKIVDEISKEKTMNWLSHKGDKAK